MSTNSQKLPHIYEHVLALSGISRGKVKNIKIPRAVHVQPPLFEDIRDQILGDYSCTHAPPLCLKHPQGTEKNVHI